MSYVISLKRRSDRLNSFKLNYNNLGPKLPLYECLQESDFTNDPNTKLIKAHSRVWSLIANNDKFTYGIVFEDDTNFREDGLFHRQWKLYDDCIKQFIKGVDIIYCGIGDCIPIHVPIPSESLLRSIEKSHVRSLVCNYFGVLKQDSLYYKKYNGTIKPFSYIISKEQAKKLLNEDIKNFYSFFKNYFSNPHVMAPLVTYNSFSKYDSDLSNIYINPNNTYTLPVDFIFYVIINYKKDITKDTYLRILQSIDDSLDCNYKVFLINRTSSSLPEFTNDTIIINSVDDITRDKSDSHILNIDNSIVFLTKRIGQMYYNSINEYKKITNSEDVKFYNENKNIFMCTLNSYNSDNYVLLKEITFMNV